MRGRLRAAQQERKTHAVVAHSHSQQEVYDPARANHQICGGHVRIFDEPTHGSTVSLVAQIAQSRRDGVGSLPPFAIAERAECLKIDLAKSAEAMTLAEIRIPEVERMGLECLPGDVSVDRLSDEII